MIAIIAASAIGSVLFLDEVGSSKPSRLVGPIPLQMRRNFCFQCYANTYLMIQKLKHRRKRAILVLHLQPHMFADVPGDARFKVSLGSDCNCGAGCLAPSTYSDVTIGSLVEESVV